ncbi:MAG: ammonium transporter [Bacteroidales bacterium]
MKKQWLIALMVFALICLLGIIFPFSFHTGDTSAIDPGDVAWMLTATALVFLMTPGLGFFYGGMVKPKNVISTILQSFIAMGLISVLWVVFGFSLAFGESVGGEGYGFFGNPATYFMFRGVGGAPDPEFAATIPLALFALFQLKFAIITPALFTGSFAGRVRFTALMIFMVLFMIFIYCPLAHWTWHPNGFLRNWGVLDFAGGTVVHMSAGMAALAGAFFFGPRRDYARPSYPANIPFVLLGTGLLWFGWFGFNAGSALESSDVAVKALLNTNTASASAMLVYIFFDGIRGRKPSALGACVGAVVGLVAITPAAGFVNVGASLFIGGFAAVASNLMIYYFSRRGVDDTLDVFPAHGIGGMTGMFLTGVFAEDVGLIHGEITTFLFHLLALVIVSAFAFGGSLLLYWITNKIVPMRVPSVYEDVGLDMSQHDETLFYENDAKVKERREKLKNYSPDFYPRKYRK